MRCFERPGLPSSTEAGLTIFHELVRRAHVDVVKLTIISLETKPRALEHLLRAPDTRSRTVTLK